MQVPVKTFDPCNVGDTPFVCRISDNWPARQWDVDTLRELIGSNKVELYDEGWGTPGPTYMKASRVTTFNEFFDDLQNGNLQRMFLYKIMEDEPQLRSSIIIPWLPYRILHKFHFMFIGGKDAITQCHQDIDWGNVLHTNLTGTKTFYLYSPKDQYNVYRHPSTMRSYVNPVHPDYDTYPKQKDAVCWSVTLQPGDTLFIPSGWFHHVVYHSISTSITVRFHKNWGQFLRGVYNLSVRMTFDKIMNKIVPRWWWNYKSTVR